MADRNGYIGRAPADSAVTVARQTFSPTGVTTDFTFASGYVAGYFDIYLNGVKMIEGSDYTSTDGSTFSILNGGATSGDVIEGVAYKAFNAATATVGIYSGGDPISTQANILNFVGTGNTFALRGSTVDISISGGGAGAGGTFAVNSTGIHTTKSVGIGTTTATGAADTNNTAVLNVGIVTANSLFGTLTGDVTGTATGLSGSPNITINNLTGVAATFTGVLTYEDVTNVDSLGLGTFRSGVEVFTGTATTALIVEGDARITGILTVGSASVTIDGENNTISTGIVTITNSSVIIGDNVSIDTGASGINSAPNVFYVAKDGDDDNNGTSIDNAKLTIAGAVSVASSGSVIKVLSGNYVEANPIELPAFSAVIGDDLRTVKVLPNTPTSDIFHVNKGCKVSNITLLWTYCSRSCCRVPHWYCYQRRWREVERALHSKLHK